MTTLDAVLLGLTVATPVVTAWLANWLDRRIPADDADWPI